MGALLTIVTRWQDPLDSRLAEEFYASRASYDANARASKVEHASRSVDELTEQLLTDS